MLKHREFHLITGNCGSGKTYYARNLQANLGDAYGIVDDAEHFNEILEATKQHQNLIITDPRLCCSKARERAEKILQEEFPECAITWYFFENNIDQCRKNVKLRNDDRDVEGTLRRFAKSYVVPSGLTPIPVWTD